MKRNQIHILCFFLLLTLLAGMFLQPKMVNAFSPDSVNSNDTNKLFTQPVTLGDASEISIDTQATILTTTVTVEPPGSYERPVIVVQTYSLDQDTISPGSAFTLFVTLYNAGQQYATNIVATFASASGDLVPRQTGGVVAVGEIAPGNHAEFGQPLYLNTDIWTSVVSIHMSLSYTNEAGITYSESFTITLPVHYIYSSKATATPTPTVTPTPSFKPQLVITGYSTDIDPLQPGTQFNLTINIANSGAATAKNVTMVVGGGSSSSGGDTGTPQPGGVSGGSGEFTNFAPINSSNVQSLGDFSPGTTKTAFQPLIVNVSTAAGAYPLKISFIYINDRNQTFVDDQVITLLVYRIPNLEISFYQDVSSIFAGQSNTLPVQVVNMGRSSVVLGNMSVSGTSGQFSNNTIFVGNLEPGGYFTLDATYIPDGSGVTDVIVSVGYTDDFNQSQIITQTLPVDVLEQPIIEPPSDGMPGDGSEIPPQAPETFVHKVLRFILGLIGLDSALNTAQSAGNNLPMETIVPGEPIIAPAQPLKGP